MTWEEAAINIFSEYSSLLAFIAGLLAGDLQILLGILSGAGKANFFIIVFFCFIGGVAHDTLFYFISNSQAIQSIKKTFRLSQKKNKLARIIERLGNGNYFWPVLLAKFIYGVRDAVVLYVAHGNKNFKKYLLTVSAADLIWAITITSLGWLAGKGFSSVLRVFRGLEKVLLIICIGLVLIYAVKKFITSFLFKKIKS